jgi:Zn-dependent protease with chaperone function
MREECQARIFGPGLPPAGTEGTLSISITGAEISAGERHQRAPLSEVTLREVGFDKPGVEVAWNDIDGVWAAHVLDPVAARRLLTSSALSGTPQAAALQQGQRRARVRTSVGRTVLLLFLALPVLLLILFAMSAGGIAGWIADRVAVQQEIALGRMSFDSMRSGLKLKDDGPAYEAARSIVERLTRGSRFTYEVHIAQDDSPNAFALPGGVIVVHTGLIAATRRPEELAGVLAHEVQHVELRHSMRGLIKDMGLRGLWAFVTGDIGSSMAGQAALELTSLRFSRDDEREADEHGFDALVAAGIDPSGMPAFFSTLAQSSGGQVPAFLSTHPASEDRDRHLRQRLATVAQQTFPPLSSQPWPPK